MKITAISTATYRWPRHKPITNGKHTYTHAGVGLVQIETDAGVTGIGLGDVGGIAKAAIEYFTPLLIGEDPLDVERLWHKMWVPKLVGRRGITTRAISAIDIGLWDLRAKVAGMPLYKLLGGYRDRVPTYIAGGYYEPDKGLPELAQEMIDNVALGAAVDGTPGAIEIHMQAGDALLFVDSLSHGSARRLNPGQRRIMVYRYGPSWGNFRFGYHPSPTLLERLTPARRQIVYPLKLIPRVPNKRG